ncbi:acyl-CoA N-acyltransferase [Multifurca ochricompacta]|uniref:histone acetyltransferase n=1 Tax=Multifurca ochricompacta TaxID=376703 RepID=A0AAD4MBQ9_9AGAM|nr:acyl-CoA N-acyltransferase [Multifurca ochricompacta]
MTPPLVHNVSRTGVDRKAHVLDRRPNEVFVHYLGTDKRLDEWVPADTVRESTPPRHSTSPGCHATSPPRANGTSSRKRRRTASPANAHDPDGTQPPMGLPTMASERRNFDKVNFGSWQIKTWYFSPYPLTDGEGEDAIGHGRTMDLFAGAVNRENAGGILWVCDRCFKYMGDGTSWEAHMRKCTRKHPPGRKVYQRGAHTIWEVDGAKEKLYCQNLSLFGKLFIDIKTLFFDCDNFQFYIFTDADSQRDHVLGFFSKEKISYDDYNLACIVVLPPYQKKGYGMLLIEFSYELSRRAGRIGTPERPLSDLGLRSYLAYWVSTLIRFLRQLLSTLPPDLPPIKTMGSLPDLSHIRTDVDVIFSPQKRTKRAKGWDGESGAPSSPEAGSASPLALPVQLERTYETVPASDGSAAVHVVVHCTLADLARATNLRVEDAAFALNECGLLVKREGDGDAMTIAISREMVEDVARERNVKRMCIDFTKVLL